MDWGDSEIDLCVIVIVLFFWKCEHLPFSLKKKTLG